MLLSLPAEPAASLQGAEISQSSERCKYLLSGHLCHPCSHPPQWPLPSWKFHKGPSMRLEKRGESWGHRVLCPFCELSLLTFLPSKSSDVNNSGRFSITLILSSKWLALKILEIKQQKYYFCPEKKKKISTLLFLSAAFWPISSRAPFYLLCGNSPLPGILYTRDEITNKMQQKKKFLSQAHQQDLAIGRQFWLRWALLQKGKQKQSLATRRKPSRNQPDSPTREQ